MWSVGEAAAEKPTTAELRGERPRAGNSCRAGGLHACAIAEMVTLKPGTYG